MLDKQDKISDATLANSVELVSSNRRIKVTYQDLEHVKNLIEECLQLYMSREQTTHSLCVEANIESVFTNLVWKELEEQNPDFFDAYHTRLQLKKQIKQFNELVEKHYHLIKQSTIPIASLASVQNTTCHLPGNQMPMGFQILQQPQIPPSDNVEMNIFDSFPIPQVYKRVPALANVQSMPMAMNSEDNMGMGKYVFQTTATDIANLCHNPMLMASNDQFPFSGTDMAGLNKTNTLKSEFQFPSTSTVQSFTSEMPTLDTSHLTISEGLQLEQSSTGRNSSESVPSMQPIPWDLSLPKFSREELKILEVEEFFVDPIFGSCSSFHLGEENPSKLALSKPSSL